MTLGVLIINQNPSFYISSELLAPLEWWPDIHTRAQVNFPHIFENYCSETPNTTILRTALTTTTSTLCTKVTHTWEHKIYSNIPTFVQSVDCKLQEFLSGAYPCPAEVSTLDWWKVHNLITQAHISLASHMLWFHHYVASIMQLYSVLELYYCIIAT